MKRAQWVATAIWCGVVVAGGASGASAQVACFGGAALGDGIRVEFSLYSDGEQIEPPAQFCRFEEGAGYLRRILTLAPGRAFGYELHVKRNPPGRPPFHVSVSPARAVAAGYFPQDPRPVDVGPKETVEFVVLENRQSRLRLIERFRVFDARDAGSVPRLDTYQADAFPPGETPLRIAAPRLIQGGSQGGVAAAAGRSKAEVRGRLVWVWVPDKGRFWFSTTERGRFRKAARARAERLEFEWDGARYALECAQPVIDLPGEWVLWVRLEAGWRPEGIGAGEAEGGPHAVQLGAVGDGE